MSRIYLNNNVMKKKELEKISLDADKLLDSEMVKIEGGSESSGCSADDQLEAPWGGCEKCNKNNSCQTRT